jgi:hypothetical protein
VGPDPGAAAPSEAELRAAYEAELSRITSTDMILQAAVSLLNIAAHRLGPPGGETAGAGVDLKDAQVGAAVRDLEQVRDGIDGVRALLEILDRRIPAEVRPLRDALSRLQLAYAREAQSAAGPVAGAGNEATPAAESPAEPTAPAAAAPGAGGAEQAEGEPRREEPGPAQASGRLWVPGR